MRLLTFVLVAAFLASAVNSQAGLNRSVRMLSLEADGVIYRQQIPEVHDFHLRVTGLVDVEDGIGVCYAQAWDGVESVLDIGERRLVLPSAVSGRGVGEDAFGLTPIPEAWQIGDYSQEPDLGISWSDVSHLVGASGSFEVIGVGGLLIHEGPFWGNYMAVYSGHASFWRDSTSAACIT